MAGEILHELHTSDYKRIRKWKVPSNSDPTKGYVVSLLREPLTNKTQNYECGCMAWTRRRLLCSHIKTVIKLRKLTAKEIIEKQARERYTDEDIVRTLVF